MKKFEIHKKIINHLTKNGEKKTSENLVLKCLKKLQKDSIKQSKNIIILALLNATSVFQIHTSQIKKQKKKKKKIKEMPFFLSTNQARLSLAIKFILKSAQNKKINRCFEKLNDEIFSNIFDTGEVNLKKNTLQEKALLKRRYFRFYSWKK